MSFIRDLAEHVRYDLELALKVPLRKDGPATLGVPKTPLEYGIAGATKNTAIPVEFDKRAFLVQYDRSDISTFFATTVTASLGLKLTVGSVKTTQDLVEDLNNRYCLNLRRSDIIDEPLAITFATTSVTVKMSPTCLWFTGQLVLPLRGSYEQQGDVLVHGFDFDPRPWLHSSDPTDRTSVVNGGLLTYGNSYIAQNTALAAIPVTRTQFAWGNQTVANATALAAALKAVDGLPWTYSASYLVPYNLSNSCVWYNGPAAGFNPREIPGFSNFNVTAFWEQQFPRTDHSHVLVVCPNPNYGVSNLLYAPLFIHYGSLIDDTVVPVDKPPVHWWPLSGGDLTNHGSAGGPAWTIPVNFTINSNGTWATLKSQGLFALGTTLDCTKDFTLSIKLFRNDASVSGDANSLEGIFTNAANGGNGALINNGGWCYLQGAMNVSNDPFNCYVMYADPVRLTISKKASDTKYWMYLNDQLVAEHSIASNLLLAFTHFGKGGAALMKTNLGFSDIRFYDYAMTPSQVKKMNG